MSAEVTQIQTPPPSNISHLKARLKAWVGSAQAGRLLRTGRVTGGTGGATALPRVLNLTGEPPVPGCGLLIALIDGDGLGKN